MSTGLAKAVVLLSGGLDSATVLAIAREQGYDCYALSFNYHQRHSSELQAAHKIAKAMNVREHKTIDIDLSAFGGSALTDNKIAVPLQTSDTIPVTYVPARNTVFLSISLGWAEVLQTPHIFIGVNSIDYSGYPDCRPEFIKAFAALANQATKAGVEGEHYQIHTPLIQLSKAEIIKQGLKLGVDYSQTVSCYNADIEGRACGQCDSCRFRKTGFEQADVADTTRYQ